MKIKKCEEDDADCCIAFTKGNKFYKLIVVR